MVGSVVGIFNWLKYARERKYGGRNMRLSILLDGINPPPRFAVVKNSSID
jgi:hypothetical protein